MTSVTDSRASTLTLVKRSSFEPGTQRRCPAPAFATPWRMSLLLVALLPIGGGASTASASAPQPRIADFEWSEDYEGIGRHFNAYATLRGQATKVTARAGGQYGTGRFNSSAGPGKIWEFRERPFVRALRLDLYDDGVAKVRIRASAPGGVVVRERCKLVLERDDEFGDYAGCA